MRPSIWTAVVLLAVALPTVADEPLKFGGSQPWQNIFSKRHKDLTAEEERLQKFWHDYYDSLKAYYGKLDHIDWVEYYRRHGYQVNQSRCGPNGCQRIPFAPVFVKPQMQWAVPASPLGISPSDGGR